MATKKEEIPIIDKFDEPYKDIKGKRWYNGAGNQEADIVFVDCWPHDEIKRTNRPLSDRIGRCLQWLLKLADINPKRCYYTYAVKYPQNGKKPSAYDKKICETMLNSELMAIKPKVIVAFGAEAWASVDDPRAHPFACCRGEPILGPWCWHFPTLSLQQVMLNGGEGYKDSLELKDIAQHFLVHTAVRELKTVKRLADGEDVVATNKSKRPQYDVLTTPEEVDFVHEHLAKKGGLLCLDCEWEGRNWLDPDRYIRTIQIGYDYGKAVIIKLTEAGGIPCYPDHNEIMASVKRLLEDKSFGIVGHNVISDGEWLLQEGIDIRQQVIYDTMLGEYLLCEDGPFGLEECAMKYAPYGRYCCELECWVHAHAKECKLGFGNVQDEILLPYGAADVDCLRYIMDAQLPMIKKLGYMEPRGTQKEYPSMLQTTLNTQRIIYEIEGTGLPVDKDRLYMLIDIFQKKRAELLAQVVSGAAVAGMPNFNPGSSAQVRELLFQKLGLPPVKTTAGKDWAAAVGNYGMDDDISESPGTDKQTLEILGDAHPLVHALLQFRRIDQYCKTWLRYKDPKNPERGLEGQMWDDGRLHSRMSQLSTTSRFKSSAPNVQNFPKRAEGFFGDIFGKDNIPPVIRTVVVPPDGYVMMESDFKQAELFTIASLSGDPHMLDVLQTPGRDMHTSIASKAFGYHMFDESNKEWTEDDIVELVAKQYGGDSENEEFTKWQKHLVFRNASGEELTYSQFKSGPRISGKNVNFGILYGRGAADTAIQVKAETGTEESLDVLTAQLDAVIRTWKESEYTQAWAFIESCMAKAYDPGYITNPFGRIRRAPFLLRGEKRADVERNFSNFPIQSTVADTVQIAMDLMQKWRDSHGMHFQIQNQIHDAVMLHVPKDEIEETKDMFHKTMGSIHIPLGPDKYFTLGVDIDVYERWGKKI